MPFNSLEINTPLGPMLAIADEHALLLLEFKTKRHLNRELARLETQCVEIRPGRNPILITLESELQAYFAGTLTCFQTPYRVVGSPFQLQVWQALAQVSYGETKSYAEQACSIGKPSAYRAVANANGANQLAIILPCHRIIASQGGLGGYGGGIELKRALLAHEQLHQKKSASHVD